MENKSDMPMVRKAQFFEYQKKTTEALEGGNPELANSIDRKIKALNPEPGVYTMIEKKRTKLLSSAMDKTRLVLKDIQFEGKKPMPFFQYQKPLS